MTVAEVPWLTDEEQATWRAFSTVSRLVEGALDRQLVRDSGMSHAHYSILVALSESEGETARMGDLADFLQFSPSRMSHAVRRMEEAGWIERRRCSSDGRGQEAMLTPRGRETLERAAPGHVREVRRLFVDQIEPEERDQIRRISEMLLTRMVE